MTKFSYKNVAKEQGWNFDAIKPIVINNSGFDYYEELKKHITPSTILLDIGCGSGEKTLKIFANAKKVVMIDSEIEMLKRVEDNKQKLLFSAEQQKIETKLANGQKVLPFADETFDLVVSRHCGANMKEVFRILKSGGIFISEDVDDHDCLELKKYFSRGQNWGYILKNTFHKTQTFEQCKLLGFSQVVLKDFELIEYYKNKEQLKFLLTRTPILQYYNEQQDDAILNKYIADFTKSKGIELKRNLYAFYLVK